MTGESVFFERSLVPRLLAFLTAHPGLIHILVGARQVGRSTVCGEGMPLETFFESSPEALLQG